MFQVGFKAVSPCASPVAFSYSTGCPRADFPPLSSAAGSPLLFLGRIRREMFESYLLSKPFSFFKCPLLHKMWHQRGYDNTVTRLQCWAGISWGCTSFKKTQFVLNNKVIALRYVHLVCLFITTCARMHLCKAVINGVKFILAITSRPTPETNLTHNI